MRRKANAKHFLKCLPTGCRRSKARGRCIIKRKIGVLALVTVLALPLASCSRQKADTEKGGQTAMGSGTVTGEMAGGADNAPEQGIGGKSCISGTGRELS